MQCLLFCPDEKSALALIPLVEAPDISVKHETEVFSATRTLMSESFAFLIIDCEDEPTRRLFLKNAGNSALNRTALAVAVVKRETAANALRFGADFLMTKPVTLEQADKVLRLVRTSILRNHQFAPPKRVTAANPPEPAPESADAEPEISIPALEMTMAAAAAAAASATATEPGQISFSEPEAPVESIEPTALPPPISSEHGAEPPPPAAMTVAQIKKPQPRSFMVPMAMAIILLVAGAIAWHIQSRKVDEEPAPAPQVVSAPVQPEVNATPSNANVTPADQTPEQVAAEPIVSQPGTSPVHPKHAHQESVRPDAPAILPGQLSIHSTPSGAGVQIDGQEVSAGSVPSNPTGLAPGHHNITISKLGYAPETRTVQIAPGGKSSLSVQLVPLAAAVSATSDPPDASLWIDGKDTGRVTPAEFSVDQPGDHIFVFKKQGYLDETIAANLLTGQTFHLAPTLRALGRTDDIKVVGKFKKLFGGGETAGMGTVSIKTQPKGAQIAVNNQTLDKPSPAEFYLDPGTYVIDITQSGYKIIHRTVTVEKDNKLTIDEVMDPE